MLAGRATACHLHAEEDLDDDNTDRWWRFKHCQRAGLAHRTAAHTAPRWARPCRSQFRRRERPWKYYDATKLDLSQYTASEADPAVVSAPAGIEASTLLNANEDLRALAELHLSKSVPVNRSKFTALHYAHLADAVVVSAVANTEQPQAVRITRDYAEADGVMATPHTLIVTGANARISVIEEFRSGEGDLLVLPAVELVPGPGSTIRYTVIHRWGDNTRVFSEQRTITERDATVTSLAVAVGGAVVKSHIESSLEGRGSASELLALTYGYGDQHIDFYTVQDHIGPDTRSDLLFKAALTDEARAVYYGMTRVGLGARNADAIQENRNLILSDGAKADSDPVLEILTNDVIRVSHGATAGPVDRDSLFYLQARGIAYEAAEQMLVQAFLGQVVDRIPDIGLRDEVAGLLGIESSGEDVILTEK